MHDLQFVRTNLALVEEKLRARGQDPAALLGNFADLDAERRERITEAETLKARRNVLSEEVGRKKRLKEDATALMEETRQLKEKLETLDASASATDEQLRAKTQEIFFTRLGRLFERHHPSADRHALPRTAPHRGTPGRHSHVRVA